MGSLLVPQIMHDLVTACALIKEPFLCSEHFYQFLGTNSVCIMCTNCAMDWWHII